MPRLIDRILPDRFILWLLATVGVATLLPVRGIAADVAEWATLAAIFLLFFLHGARLPREALVKGFTDWRLHLAIFAATFILFPLAGLALSRLLPGLFSPEIWMGILFLCALPSTVQSSIAYTSMAGGNVAGAVAAAAGSQLLGVFLTPLLLGALLAAQGGGIALGGIWKIVLTLFVPFVLGHLLRAKMLGVIERHPNLVFAVDKGTILLAVYAAFSAAMLDGLWQRVPPAEIGVVAGFVTVLLIAALGATAAIGRLGGFAREDRVAILFCGTFKSVVSGVPMAHILFPGAAVGFVILPIMLYHAAQLVACAWVAAWMGQRVPSAERT